MARKNKAVLLCWFSTRGVPTTEETYNNNNTHTHTKREELCNTAGGTRPFKEESGQHLF